MAENELRVWYDEATGVVFNKDSARTVEMARDSLRRAQDLMEGRPRRLLLIDLSDAPLTLPSDVRRGIMEEVKTVRVDRQAFVVSNPIIRMLAKAIARMTSEVNKSAFFGTTEEALAWLKRED